MTYAYLRRKDVLLMKKLLCLLLAVSMILCFAACGGEVATTAPTTTQKQEPPKEYSNEVQVVVLLGQSNGEGHTHSQYLPKTVGEEKAALYAQGFEKVKISYACTIANNTSNGQFVPVKLGQGTNVGRFGPEIGMAEKIAELDPQKQVYIIKYAYGGTTLNSQWRSPSSKNTGGLYKGAVEYILQQCQALEEMELYPVIKAVCWMQGESDASGTGFGAYETLEANFVKDLRNDLAYYKPADAEIGFVDAGISQCVAWTHYQEINQAKQNLAAKDENHDYIDTIGAGLKFNAEPAGAPDIYHYDSKSMVELGYLFAQVLLLKYLEV